MGTPAYDLAGRVIGYAMRVHSTLGPGYFESVYKKALIYELRSAGYTVEEEKHLTVYYKGQVVGEFIADLVVNGQLIVEAKAIQQLAPIHEVQLVNYLTITGTEQGLLLNFGASRLEYKKKFRTYKPTSQEAAE